MYIYIYVYVYVYLYMYIHTVYMYISTYRYTQIYVYTSFYLFMLHPCRSKDTPRIQSRMLFQADWCRLREPHLIDRSKIGCIHATCNKCKSISTSVLTHMHGHIQQKDSSIGINPIPRSKPTYIHTYIHTYVHTCVYIHIYICAHTATSIVPNPRGRPPIRPKIDP